MVKPQMGDAEVGTSIIVADADRCTEGRSPHIRLHHLKTGESSIMLDVEGIERNIPFQRHSSDDTVWSPDTKLKAMSHQ